MLYYNVISLLMLYYNVIRLLMLYYNVISLLMLYYNVIRLLMISCSSSSEKGNIQILNGNYGRRDILPCSFQRPAAQLNNTNCLSQSISTNKVAESCNGMNQCVVQVSSSV
ncbi:hypothetical protein DPEC_G00016840 [Dallia pectoralis]|uniref:Uncharacterized protein n=1 Tax=Dallia pectoralis TaxID=75939 RepID=A0ACC2HMQ6_DALPE|nr:hypothetical protein DPEC_G00016840 [Dallia pectoralis]